MPKTQDAGWTEGTSAAPKSEFSLQSGNGTEAPHRLLNLAEACVIILRMNMRIADAFLALTEEEMPGQGGEMCASIVVWRGTMQGIVEREIGRTDASHVEK